MRYCTRCVYPEIAATGIAFDEKGVCSGCNVAEEKETIDWRARKKILGEILEKYRNKDGSNYDCIIPVSGVKDSHFQTYILREEFGLNPLLVTFNHEFNTKVGIRNLTNMIKKFCCDHIRLTPNPELVKKLARVSLKKMGDFCWHCHAGIFTFPVQIAVKYKIPLIIYGEHEGDLTGSVSHYKFEDITYEKRTAWCRGFDWNSMIDEEEGITKQDLLPFMYPSDKEIKTAGVRAIHLGYYIPWDHKKQTELMIKDYGFETARESRTYNCYENVECHHCGGAHDYLKWLKFGYGRATDHASQDIRLGRITREEGIDLVREYDPKRPEDLDTILEFLEMTEEEFIECINPMRDKRAWKKNEKGEWILRDPVWNYINDQGVDEVRLPLNEDESKEYILTLKESKFVGGHVLM